LIFLTEDVVANFVKSVVVHFENLFDAILLRVQLANQRLFLLLIAQLELCQLFLESQANFVQRAVSLVRRMFSCTLTAVKLFANLAAEFNLETRVLLAEELFGIKVEVVLEIQTFVFSGYELLRKVMGGRLDVRQSLAEGCIFVAVVDLEAFRHPLFKRAFPDVFEKPLCHRMVEQCALFHGVKRLRQSLDLPPVLGIVMLLLEECRSCDDIFLVKPSV